MTTENTSKKNNKTKKKTPRCAFIYEGIKCRTKLRLTDYPCRCNNIYCSKHRLPESHNCKINYKEINNDQYLSNLGGGKYKKIEAI